MCRGILRSRSAHSAHGALHFVYAVEREELVHAVWIFIFIFGTYTHIYNIVYIHKHIHIIYMIYNIIYNIIYIICEFSLDQGRVLINGNVPEPGPLNQS